MKYLSASFFILAAVIACFGQHGGKAEPKRIQFAKGRSSIVLTETLKNGVEMEYVFGARKGQRVTVKNPQPSLFDFRIFSDEFDMEADFNSSRTYTLEIPQTGDYQLFVRKKMVKTPRTARFRISLEIK